MRDDAQYMVVEKEEQYMLIDKAGNVIFTVNGPLTYYPKTNLCDMMDKDMMYVVLDTEGNQKIPGQFELVYMIDQSMYALSKMVRYSCVIWRQTSNEN